MKRKRLSIEERVVNAAREVSQLEARRRLGEMQRALRQKVRIRREERTRRQELGRAVMIAGCGNWDALEIIGLLLDGMERVGASATMRLGMRQRGEFHSASVAKRPNRRMHAPAGGSD